MAQTATGGADGAPSEAARRQALGPYRFILQNASAPAAAPKPKPAPEPVAATKKAAPQPASEQTAAARPSAPEPVAEPAPAQPEPVPVAVAAPTAKPAAPIVAVKKALVPIKQDPPELSGALLREHPTGTVKVGFEVMPDGSTSGVKVLASTNRKLNNVSMQAVANWKFQPIDDVRPLEIELVFSE